MRNLTDVTIRELARTQHGLVARRQLRRRGVGTDAIAARVASGALEELSARVLRVAGAAPSPQARLLAGVLDAGDGAVASHRSAAALWELPGFELLPAEVTGRRPRVSHGRHPLAVVHQPRCLTAPHSTELSNIPVTTPTRTLFDLAGLRGFHPKRLERVLDSAWARGLVSHGSLLSMLRQLQRRGRPGIATMRALISARGPAHVPPSSNAEARFQELAARVGLVDFRRQVDLGDDDAWIGRVDFVDERRGLVVEVDPHLHHSSLTDRTRDEMRRKRLEHAGWVVVCVTERDLFHRPDVLLARLREHRWRAA